jgi:membrane protease subunit HflK
VIAQATGEVSRFSQLLNEYKKAPDVTRQRIYVESMESVLSKSNTVMVDVKSNNLLLPLDKMLQKAATAESETQDSASVATAPVAEKRAIDAIVRTVPRGREERGRE